MKVNGTAVIYKYDLIIRDISKFTRHSPVLKWSCLPRIYRIPIIDICPMSNCNIPVFVEKFYFDGAAYRV